MNAVNVCVNSAYKLPTADGTGGYLICTDGSGTLGWTEIPSSLWNDGSGYIYPNNYCNVCIFESGGSGGCLYVACEIYGSNQVSAYCGCFGTICTDYLCYCSQGCICVCACLLDCNGNEILGGAAGLWYDGGGYICPNNSCPICMNNCFMSEYCICTSDCICAYAYNVQGYDGWS